VSVQDTLQDTVSTVLMVAGTAVLVVASVGASLPRSALVRLHYLSMAAMAGAPLVLLGVLVRDPADWFKLVLVTVLVVASSPMASAATARAISRGGPSRSGAVEGESS
jgi:multisubunit Na+/H+ antiporter MnhG subunit